MLAPGFLAQLRIPNAWHEVAHIVVYLSLAVVPVGLTLWMSRRALSVVPAA